MSDTILVTGGAGFVGANLVRHILQLGARVRIFDDFSTGRWENLASVATEIEVQEGDVRDLRTLRRATAGTRAIVHLAALPGTLPDHDETRMLDVNVKGTLCALMAAREFRLPLVFASSAAVYGARDAYLLHEKMAPEPKTPLGTQKLAGELYCRLFYETHGTRTTVLRIFNAFGPFEEPRAGHASVVARFAGALVQGRAPVLFGDGSQTRDFVYVSNVCEAIWRALRAVDAAGEILNVGSGEAIAINLLYNQMTEVAGIRRAPLRAPSRPGDLRHVRAALGHAMSMLKYAPHVRLREGLERTIQWHKERLRDEQSRSWFAPPSPAIAEAEPTDPEPRVATIADVEVEDDGTIPIYEVEEVGA